MSELTQSPSRLPKMIDDISECAERIRFCLQNDEEMYQRLGARLRLLNPTVVATIARGSSDHAANYAGALIAKFTGTIVASIPPSTVTVLKSKLNLKGQFALAISQSGASPDILETFSNAQQGGAVTAAIVNDTESALARATDFLLPQHAGPESIAATKSMISTLVAIARLVASWSQNQELAQAIQDVPERLATALSVGTQLDENLLVGISHVYVVSRGYGLSAALEIALKLKETCGVQAEGFSSAEVLHGPREIVDASFLIIALALPGCGPQQINETVLQLKAQGAKLWVVDPTELFPSLHPALAPVVTLQMLYPWIARCSQALGRDPDVMKNLKSKVVKTT